MLVIGCIKAKFCKKICVGKLSLRSTQWTPLHRFGIRNRKLGKKDRSRGIRLGEEIYENKHWENEKWKKFKCCRYTYDTWEMNARVIPAIGLNLQAQFFVWRIWSLKVCLFIKFFLPSELLLNLSHFARIHRFSCRFLSEVHEIL